MLRHWASLLCLLLLSATYGASLIASEVPLKPLAATPAGLLEHNSSTQLSERHAITVVYSQTVIALGSDVKHDHGFGEQVPFTIKCAHAPVPPGRYRWLNATTASYTPDVDWPTDLDCTLEFNRTLTTYDGETVQLPDTPPHKLYSEPLSMFVSHVTSESATELTGGAWSAYTGMPDWRRPEVPPDGVLQLHFNYPVDLDLIQEALQLQPNPTDIRVHVSPRTRPSDISLAVDELEDGESRKDSRVLVSFSAPLEHNIMYELLLPAGSRYSTLTGPTTKEESRPLSGLRPFTVLFKRGCGKEDNIVEDVKYRRLRIWLPHGLKDNSTSGVQALLRQFSLCAYDQTERDTSPCIPVPITSAKLVSPAYIQLQIDALQPDTKYKISVASNDHLLDGYGKPLQDSSGVFLTAAIEPHFEAPTAQPVAVFDHHSLPDSWPFMVHGIEITPGMTAVWSLDVTGADDVDKLVAVLGGYGSAVDSVFGPPSAELQPCNDNVSKRMDLPLDPTKHVHLVCDKGGPASKGTNYTSMQLILRSRLSTTWVMAGQQGALVWVTDMNEDSPGPVEGATAHLYALDWTQKTRKGKKLGQCVTGSDGSCQMAHSTGGLLTGVVQGPDNELMVKKDLHLFDDRPPRNHAGTLLLDRAFIKPGGTLHVTGYVAQKSERGSLSVKAPEAKRAVLVVSPDWTNSSDFKRLDVDVDTTYGSLHAAIPIPASAIVGDYKVSLYVPILTTSSEDTIIPDEAEPIYWGGISPPVLPGYTWLYSQIITVSDPSPPTAELVMNAPKWVPPTGKLTISLQAISYLGSQVSGAPIHVTWEHETCKGGLHVAADSTGAATATIDLGALPPDNISFVGDGVEVQAVWTTPNKERIVRKTGVRLQLTGQRVKLSQTYVTDLPGVAFGIGAEVYSNEDNSLLASTPLVATLKPNSTNDMSSDEKCNKGTACTFQSGDGSGRTSCQLSLPCVGVYLLEVCTNDNKERACSNMTLGRNATGWVAQPLKSRSSPKLFLNAPHYSIGDTASLQFQNPWQRASALVVWGNAVQPLQRKFLSEVQQGPVSLDIRIGKECVGGCTVAVLLSVPASGNMTNPEGVVFSNLFDPARPHTRIMRTSLTIKEPRKLDVSVIIQASDNVDRHGAEAPVISPGANATLHVKVLKDDNPVEGAEVTLLAVNKAVLSMMPYPLRDILPELTLKNPAFLQFMQSEKARLKPGIINTVFSTLERRLAIDPWLPLITTVLPNDVRPGYTSTVDADDAEYLDYFTSDLTYSPRATLFDDYDDHMMDDDADEIAWAERERRATSSSSSSGGGLSSSLHTTPLFSVIHTQSDGTGEVTFTAPDIPGTYTVRAFAVQAESSGVGSAETSVIVRRDPSLTATTPHLMTVGDAITVEW